jgi:cytosine/adenosine deaminase-related metal-dependent hydrolase
MKIYYYLNKLILNYIIYLFFLQTLLAHGVHLEDSELAILKERGTAIIHCPSSNTYLRSGLCDVQRLRANNIKVGLGTGIIIIFLPKFNIIN